MEAKQKHLEFIQTVINRMAQNSFVIKGWAITLVSALFALSAANANQKFAIVAYFPCVIFWILDSYYLYQERLFRKLYDNVREQEQVDFSLSTKDFDNGIFDWASAAFSKTILLFYGITIITIYLVMYQLK